MARPTTFGNTARVASLVAGASQLLAASLAPSSTVQYQRAWARYKLFCKDIQASTFFPASVATLSLFITHLASPPITASAATIATTISAISYFHKLSGVEDPTGHFLIRKILKGTSKLHPAADLRIPIAPSVLQALIVSSKDIASSPYEAVLIAAMFSLMFHAFLRIGEVTVSPHNLSYGQVVVSTIGITVTFITFKHSLGNPMALAIPPSSLPTCPVKLLQSYLRKRGSSPGPLFCYPGLAGISPAQFRTFLNMALARCNLSSLWITPHSFRIGAATFAASKGSSTSQIQAMGRWKSSAFLKYIRIQSITLPS